MSHGKPLDAGVLRHVVKIQQPIGVQDEFGSMVNTWVDVWPRVYASIDPLSAREFIAASNLENKISARITIRFREGITGKMRVVHGSKIYNIEGVLTDVDSGREYITLPCSEGVNEG